MANSIDLREDRHMLGEAMVEEMLTWPSYQSCATGDDDYPGVPSTDEEWRAYRGDHVAAAALRVIRRLREELEGVSYDGW